MSKKACKSCKRVIMQGNICPNCKGGDFTSSFQGNVFVFEPANSEIAQKLGIKEPGKYALRVK